MPTVKMYDMAGNVKGDVELAEGIFGCEVNEAVLHSVIRAYLLNQRQGTQSTKTRSEVSGGGRKPWKQKGTGRARQGSTRSPQWTHGGIALGPKPRTWKITMNKKVKRIALKSALSSKVLDGNLIVIDSIATEEYKTKKIAAMLKALGADKKALIVLPTSDAKVVASAKNIPGVKIAYVNTLNVYDILNCNLFVVARGAAEKMQEVYA